MLEFAILGPLEVRYEGRTVDVGGPQRRAVLVALLLRHGEPVGADVLIQALWGDEAPPSATRSLYVHVSRLRRALGAAASRLCRDASGYRLIVRPGELDADRFELALDEGRALLADGRPSDAARVLRGALALWRGPVLADLRYEAFTQPEITRLEELRMLAVEDRVEAELALGEHARLLGELDVLIDAHPTRERLRGQHMLALYRSGRHADALAAYRRARAVLDAELGLEPGPELRRLEQAILAHDPELAPPAETTLAVPPAPPTPTFGRDEDVERIVALLRESRCLTLVGPGGVGKTRLAIEVARYAGGQFVSLAATTDAERVPAVICDALEAIPVPGESPADALDRVVGRGPRLLVVDNLEHLPGAGTLLAGLLDRHPGLRLLVTSRQPLRIRAERVFPVEPLDDSPAAALFVDRARAQDPSFALTSDVAAAVTAICTRLSGLPLAIELAAARLTVLTPGALAERLDDALGVLGAGPQDAPRRHRTLRATLDWSIDLLDESGQDAFAALAVFARGGELEAAEAVTGSSVQVLESLVAQSLVTARTGRLTMLEPVRQYAVERLAARPDADALRDRHLRYYLGLAERSEDAIWAFRRSCPEYAVLRREHDNLFAAVEWGLRSGPPLAVVKLIAALGTYTWFAGASGELRRWWDRAFAGGELDLPPAVRARAELARAGNAIDPPDKIRRYRAALALFRDVDDDRMTARCLIELGGYHSFQGDRASARSIGQEALRVAARVGDELVTATALGELALATEDVDAAMPIAREAAERLRAVHALARCAEVLSTLGLSALIAGAYDLAEQLEREALDDALAVGDPWTVAFVHGNTGLAAFAASRLATAETAFRDQLTAAHAHGFGTFYFEGLLGLAGLAATDGDDVRAAALEAAAWALNDRPVAPSETPIYEPLHAELRRARSRLGEPAWRAAQGRGSVMSVETAMALAFEPLSVATADEASR